MDYSLVAPELLRQIQEYSRLGNQAAEAAAIFAEFIRRRNDCFLRSCEEGHITASAWVLNPAGTHVLLTHHRRLDRWFQLGGHVEDRDHDLLEAALREAREESGLEAIRPLSAAIFDLDRHLIPARDPEPAHFHYDVRYLLQAESDQVPAASGESKAVAWVELEQVARLNRSESILRMVRRTGHRLS